MTLPIIENYFLTCPAPNKSTPYSKDFKWAPLAELSGDLTLQFKPNSATYSTLSVVNSFHFSLFNILHVGPKGTPWAPDTHFTPQFSSFSDVNLSTWKVAIPILYNINSCYGCFKPIFLKPFHGDNTGKNTIYFSRVEEWEEEEIK